MLGVMQKKRVCSRCIYDSTLGGISFDGEGVCNFCRQIDDMAELYGTGKAKGEKRLQEIIRDIKMHGEGRKYDCIIGVRGVTIGDRCVIGAKVL